MAKLDKRTKGALWLLIAPTALFIVTLMLFAIINLIFSYVTPEINSGINNGGELSGGTIAVSIVNIILFLMGVVSVITWLPGIIVGIVLLATKK